MTTLYRNDIARLIANETGDTIASATISSVGTRSRPGGQAMTTILENASGVRITEKDKRHGHHLAVGALCHCGEYLIVAPPAYHPDHRKGDPVMICGDHGVHAFRFLDLVKGLQPETKP